MKQQLKDLIEEEFDTNKMLDELQAAKNDEEILSVARKIIVLRDKKDWLLLKIDKLSETQ